MPGIFEKVDPIFYYLGLSSIVKYAIYYSWKDKKPADAELAGHVQKLMLHPLKSAKGIEVKELQCSSERGAYLGTIPDRHWMVVNENYDMVSSRQEPLVSQIETHVDGTRLILTAPGASKIILDVTEVEHMNQEVDTNVQTVATKGLHCGEAASKWISDYLKKSDHHIVFCSYNIYRRGVVGGHKKYLDWTKIAKKEDMLAFHDSISFHICAEESMEDLNSRLDTPIDILRFRPNIVVTTGAKPYDEDTWRDVFIGDEVRLKTVKLCARCVLPNVDPDTATKDKDDEPLKTLRSYRGFLPSPLGPAFGIDLIVEKEGTIKAGDPIYIVRGDNVTKP